MINYSEYNNPEDLKRLKFIEDLISERVPDNGKILDIGCGIGNVSRQLGHDGYNVTAIDSDVKSIEFAKSRNTPNVEFVNKNIYEYSPVEKSYNAIICSEVLEHVIDPVAIVRLVYSILKDDGVFIATVPNGVGPRELFVTRPVIWIRDHGGFLWKLLIDIKQMFGYKGETVHSKSEHLDHIQFFTLKKFRQMADKNDFQIIKMGKANFISGVFPLSLFYRKSIRLQAFDCKLADKLPYRCVSGFFSAWVKKIPNETAR